MSIHKPTERLFVINNGLVKTSGGSTQLAKGVLAVANRNLPNTVTGVPLVNTFNATGNYEIRYGAVDTNARGKSNLSWRSLPFGIDEIIDIKASAPKAGSATDEVWIGYDGINEDSALTLENGQTVEFDVTLKSEAFAILGYKDGEYVHKIVITAPAEGDINMQALVNQAVEELKEVTLPGGYPLTDYLTITPIDSTRPALTGTAATVYTLKVPGSFISNEQALVENQFPDAKFVGSANGVSEYKVVRATAPSAYTIPTVNVTEDCLDFVVVAGDTASIAWVAGEVCRTTVQEYQLVLADDQCGEQRTAELTAFYPNLVIEAGESENCQTIYTTDVVTNFVCPECSPIILDLFTSEAPLPFDMISWTTVEPAPNPDALMGIRFEGKQIISMADAPYDKFVPFIYDFVRISVAGGYVLTVAENFPIRKDRYKARLIRRGYNPEALGYTFRDLEKQTRVYYTNQSGHCDVFAEYITGEESLLKNGAQYIMYSITIRRKRYSQSVSQTHEQNVKYDLLVEVGKHTAVETLVNAMATAAGLPTVTAGIPVAPAPTPGD